MILVSPGEVAFEIFGFPVYYYGIILAFSCLLAVYTAKVVYSKIYNDGKAEFIWEAAPFAVIFGILGARLYYCIVNLDYYIFHPFEIFYIRGGGLSIHGGLIAGILALWFSSKKYKIPFLRLLDVFSIGTVLAQAVGRWGNFFNNEAFGLPYDGFFKLFIPLSKRPQDYINYEFFHPAFLYESLLNFCVFALLLVVIKKFGAKIEGLTLSVYFILYSLVRLVVENIRVDSALDVGNVHIASIVSIIGLLAGIVMSLVLIFRYNRHKIPN